MSEELLQRNLLKNPEKIGKWDFYNIGSTTLKSLKENNIIRNVDYGTVERKKVDALIVFRKNVIAVIEYKKPAEFNTKEKQEKAIQQEIEVAKKLGCRLIIATDTQETIWVNALTGKEIKGEDNRVIKINFDPFDEKIVDLIEKINYSISELNNAIKPRQLVNPTDLAKQIWQDIWSVSGATPENCLYTFVELFIFKYLSDLGVLGEGINFNHLLDRYTYTIEKPDEKVLEYYAHTIRPEIKALFPANPIDNTTIINGTIFVSKDQRAVTGYSTVFKKILLKFRDYGKLENIDYDFKSRLFESFLKESISKKNWGQFFTPLKVVRAIVEMAKDDIKDGINICDPACGVGKFLLEPLITQLSYIYDINPKAKKEEDKIKPKIVIHGFDKGFDKDEQKTIILAKANMLIYFSDLIKDNAGLTKEFAKLFNDSFTLKTNSILGTLSDPVTEQYDLILTNPPYVTSGSSNLKEEIKKDGELVKYYKVNALGVEGLFMEWIIKALKPGGKAFVVIPDGMLNRQNDKNLRKYILDECFIDGLISLPLNTFFTTNKKTYILCMTKKQNRSEKQNTPVFTYLVGEIGESRDVYRFDIDQNDLQEAVTLFSFFKGNKQAFSKINADKRCKIIHINYFKDNIENNWLVDKLWTNEEKVELGIIEENKPLKFEELPDLFDGIASNILSLKEEVLALSEKKNSDARLTSCKLKELFDIQRGLSKYTRKYGNKNKGCYPVYSASNNEPLTFINTFDYAGVFLSWATNGFAGYVKLISGKFSINADRGLLKPKNENINISYIKYKIEPILRKLAKGRKGEMGEDEFTKVYPSMIENIEVLIPVDENGNFNISVQKEFAEKYKFIDDAKIKIFEYKKQIEKLNIEINENDGSVEYKQFSMVDIFDFQDGFAFPSDIYTLSPSDIKLIRIQDITNKKTPKNIRIPKTFSFKNSDKYKVKKGDFLMSLSGIFMIKKWDGEDGYLNQRVTKISLKEEHRNKFIKDYELILFATIYNELNTKGFSANNNLRRNSIAEITIKIPVDQNGDFDLSAQKEIAEKYKKTEQLKRNISKELDKIANIAVEVE
ncbi:MAG: N-6 DNA methylase [Planctomycetaceae bacterium]|jgi:type I restriction-modification system DNA methylase subunit|nr:N-6 DNA methylase [Planctomycetaceae bacterium]